MTRGVEVTSSLVQACVQMPARPLLRALAPGTRHSGSWCSKHAKLVIVMLLDGEDASWVENICAGGGDFDGENPFSGFIERLWVCSDLLLLLIGTMSKTRYF